MWNILFNTACCRISVKDLLSYCHFWHTYIMWSVFYLVQVEWHSLAASLPHTTIHTFNPNLFSLWLYYLDFEHVLTFGNKIGHVQYGILCLGSILTSAIFFVSQFLCYCECRDTESLYEKFVIVLCTASSLPEYSNAENFSGWIY